MTADRITGDIRTTLRHDSAHKHVAGSAVYVDDIPTTDDTLVVLIGQSPHAHARITNIDLSAVAAADGVAAVLTHADIPGVNDCSPVYGDDPVLAEDEVSYVGQAVFAIVAETMRAARDALPLANISYDERPAILTIDAAMKAGSWLGPSATMESGTPDTGPCRCGTYPVGPDRDRWAGAFLSGRSGGVGRAGRGPRRHCLLLDAAPV
jgi:xanthine dehydrogenase large subunit